MQEYEETLGKAPPISETEAFEAYVGSMSDERCVRANICAAQSMVNQETTIRTVTDVFRPDGSMVRITMSIPMNTSQFLVAVALALDEDMPRATGTDKARMLGMTNSELKDRAAKIRAKMAQQSSGPEPSSN